MQAKDQLKVLQAGFTIIRIEIREVSPANIYRAIKAKTLQKKDWHVLEHFSTSAALLKKRKLLLENPLIIED